MLLLHVSPQRLILQDRRQLREQHLLLVIVMVLQKLDPRPRIADKVRRLVLVLVRATAAAAAVIVVRRGGLAGGQHVRRLQEDGVVAADERVVQQRHVLRRRDEHVALVFRQCLQSASWLSLCLGKERARMCDVMVP